LYGTFLNGVFVSDEVVGDVMDDQNNFYRNPFLLLF
jgi:hypothetical protein